LGFFAETADDHVTLDDNELAEAVWLKPDELPPPPDAAGPLSLTATMIKAFAEGQPIF
jgi:NADH pyrophosphatase NudC (nudix superfamily)